MVSVTKSVDVEAPLSTVYNQWTQFEDFPQFMGGVDQITAMDDTHTPSRVSVALHTDNVEDQRIDQGLTETLDEVQRLVESGPAPTNT
jgi:uncharacterized membrane protein